MGNNKVHKKLMKLLTVAFHIDGGDGSAGWAAAVRGAGSRTHVRARSLAPWRRAYRSTHAAGAAAPPTAAGAARHPGTPPSPPHRALLIGQRP